MNYSIKVRKFGQSKYGNWVSGVLFNEVIAYDGIFNVNTKTELLEEQTYKVKAIEVRNTKKGTLSLTLHI